MTKPRLVKVRALFYVFQQVRKKEAAPILTQPHTIEILIIGVFSLSLHLLITQFEKMTPEAIHTKVVPSLQAALWTIALFIGTVSFQSIGNPVLVKLISVFIIFLVFIWESAIMFLDIKNANPDKNFDGEVLGINSRLFFIIPVPFIVGVLYYAYPDMNILFYLLLPIMGWIKWECSSFANNIHTHFVDIKPTFIPNKINE